MAGSLACYMFSRFESKHYPSNLDLPRQMFWKHHPNGSSFLQEKLMHYVFVTGGNFNKVAVYLENVDKLIFMALRLVKLPHMSVPFLMYGLD